MHTCHRLVKSQFASLSVCFLLLAFRQWLIGGWGTVWCRSSSCISGNGATPQLCVAQYTTASHRLRLCQPAQNNTHWHPQPAAQAWHRSPTGSSRQVSALPRHTNCCYPFPVLTKDMQKHIQRALTWQGTRCHAHILWHFMTLMGKVLFFFFFAALSFPHLDQMFYTSHLCISAKLLHLACIQITLGTLPCHAQVTSSMVYDY